MSNVSVLNFLEARSFKQRLPNYPWIIAYIIYDGNDISRKVVLLHRSIEIPLSGDKFLSDQYNFLQSDAP